jgi:hypothetical protein
MSSTRVSSPNDQGAHRPTPQPEYVRAVRTGTPSDLAESQGFDWDPKLPSMAIAHSAGLVAAVSEVLTSTTRVAGSLSSGLHHARQDRGAGYCTFNGLAVAATEALDRGAERILVLDFDAHCGGGTRSMTSPDAVVQIDVSTVMFDAGSRAHRGIPSPTQVRAATWTTLRQPCNWPAGPAPSIWCCTTRGWTPPTPASATPILLYGSGWSPSGPPNESNGSCTHWPVATPEAASPWRPGGPAPPHRCCILALLMRPRDDWPGRGRPDDRRHGGCE